MMELFHEILFLQWKFHHRCLTGLYIGLQKFWNFQSEAKLEEIIAIVTTHSVFLFCFTLVAINMPSQKRKKRRNRNCYKKQVKIVCQLKLFLREINQLLVLIRLPTHVIYKMIYRFHLKLSNLKKHPTTITMITYQMKIKIMKIQNIQMLLLTEFQRKISLNI